MATVGSAKTYAVLRNATRVTVSGAKTYAILSKVTEVTASFVVEWSIPANAVEQSFPVAWSVLSEVERSFPVEWSIGAEISASFGVSWRVNAYAELSQSVAWSVLGEASTTINIRGTASLNSTTAANAANTPDFATQAGDLILAFVQSRFYPPISIPAGFELIDYQVCDSDGFLQYLHVYKKTATESDGGSSKVWQFSASGRTDCLIVSYYNTTGAPVTVESVGKTVVNTQATRTITGPALTATKAGSRGVVGFSSVYSQTTQATSTTGVTQIIPGSSSQRRVTAGHAPLSVGTPLVNSATWSGSPASDEAFAAIGVVLSSDPVAEQSFIVEWRVITPIEASFIVSWKNEGYSVEQSYLVSWGFDAAPVTADFVVSWQIIAEVSKSYVISWEIDQIEYTAPERLIIPDFPVTEIWTWRTSVFRSKNGIENRRSYSASPVITQQFGVTSQGPEDFQLLRTVLELAPETPFDVPLFQYFDVPRPAPAGASRLYFKSSRLNLSVGNKIIVVPFDDDEDDALTYDVTAVHADGCDISPALLADVRNHTVSPVVPCRLSANATTNNAAVYSTTQFSFVSLMRGDKFVRDDNTTTLPTISGEPALLLRVSADDQVSETYDSGIVVIDNALAPPVLFKDDITRKGYELAFTFNRELSSDYMDFWRKFCDFTRGQWRAFGIPTWRNDGAIIVSGTQVTVYGDTFYYLFARGGYTGLLFQRENSRQFEAMGVTGVTLFEGNTVCTLEAELEGSGYDFVSFIMRARLASDQVTLTHNEMSTTIQVKIEMVR